MELSKSKTFINLAKSYAGECQAHVRYKFIEYGARKEGYKALADLVDTVVYNEFNHARMFYTYIQKASEKTINNIEICSGYPFKEKWDLCDNLRLAGDDEKNEATLIYPEFMEVAKKEGFFEIASLYEDIIQVENCHHLMFKDLYSQFLTDSLYKKPTSVKWKCSACGYEAEGNECWEICPLCGETRGAAMLKLNDNN